MTDSTNETQTETYDFDAVEAARLKAAADRNVTPADVLRAVEALDAKFDAVLAVVNEVKDKVSPAIDSLTKSPMFKMLGGR